MNIREIFDKKKPFIGFITGGDGGIDYCVNCCLKLIEGGIDILEIGFPFTDPIADGPVIQKSSQRALNQGANSKTILEIARCIRKKSNIPLILFSYYNVLLKKGDIFLKEAKLAGYNAVLVVDLPPCLRDVESDSFFDTIKQSDLHYILIVSPSTSDERLHRIAELSNSFIYYACQKGTTGVKNTLPEDVTNQINRIKQKTNVPVVVGFGIATAEHAKYVLNCADGFVVGSAFVKLMEKRADPIELKKLAMSIDPRNK